MSSDKPAAEGGAMIPEDVRRQLEELRKHNEALEQQLQEERRQKEEERRQKEESIRKMEEMKRQQERETFERENVNGAIFLDQPLQDAPTTIAQLLLGGEAELVPVEPVTRKASSSTSIAERRTFEHKMPTEVRHWDFFPEMDRVKGEAAKCIVRRPTEQQIDQTVFQTEKVFELFWGVTREATLKVLKESFPRLPLTHGCATSQTVNPARPDELFTLKYDNGKFRHLIVLEEKLPTVLFDISRSVCDIVSEGEPTGRDSNKLLVKNVWCTMIQTYTYMVQNHLKYGVFSNWNSWACMERRIIKGKEVLYVSPWLGLDRARLGWATLVVLACERMDATECSNTGSVFGEVPLWVRPAKKEDSSANGGGSASSGTGASGATTESSNGAKGPQQMDEVSEAYPEMTTEEAMGITALSLIEPFEVLGNTDKSHTRRIQVNGNDIVAKFVDFLGAPKHSEFSIQDLYDLEWNEVRVYHFLRQHGAQGRLVPRFLYHGSDFNHIWATAVTTYEGESLAALQKRDRLTAEMHLQARSSLVELHSLGVLHGDVALRNALWRPSDRRVVWVDFELSKLLRDVGEPTYRLKAERELQDLEDLFVSDSCPLPSNDDVPITSFQEGRAVDDVEGVKTAEEEQLKEDAIYQQSGDIAVVSSSNVKALNDAEDVEIAEAEEKEHLIGDAALQPSLDVAAAKALVDAEVETAAVKEKDQDRDVDKGTDDTKGSTQSSSRWFKRHKICPCWT